MTKPELYESSMSKAVKEIREQLRVGNFTKDELEDFVLIKCPILLSEIDLVEKDKDELVSALNEKNLGKYRIADNQISRLEAENNKLRTREELLNKGFSATLNEKIYNLEAKLVGRKSQVDNLEKFLKERDAIERELTARVEKLEAENKELRETIKRKDKILRAYRLGKNSLD